MIGFRYPGLPQDKFKLPLLSIRHLLDVLLFFLSTLWQFVGYNDEVLDVKFVGKGDSHLVVATNSSQLKVFELLTNSCQILYGHTGESPAEGSPCLYVASCVHVFIYHKRAEGFPGAAITKQKA